MKYLSAAIFILDMEIKRDKENMKFWLKQRKYFETILHRFNMKECKPIKVPIPIGVNLFSYHFPKAQVEEEGMYHVPYARAIGSLMYAMAYTNPNIAHLVGVLRGICQNQGRSIGQL
jgi:hypothetical protein